MNVILMTFPLTGRWSAPENTSDHSGHQGFLKSRCDLARMETSRTPHLSVQKPRQQPDTNQTMLGRVDDRWSPWPQLTLATAKGVQPGTEEYTKAILSTYGAEALRKSWIQVCERLRTVTDNIASQGSSVIPQLGLEDFLTADGSTRDKLKDTGCFIVRQVVSEQQATDWYHELKGYVEDNKAHITGVSSDYIFHTLYLTLFCVVQVCQPKTRSCSTCTIRRCSKQLALAQTVWPSRRLSIAYGMMTVTKKTSSMNLFPMPMAFAFDLKTLSSMHCLHISVSDSPQSNTDRC